MKRGYILCLLCLVSLIAMSCGTYENTANNSETAFPTMEAYMTNIPETLEPIIGEYVTTNPEIIPPTPSCIPEAIPTASSGANIETDQFVGEYNDVDCDEPNLEIKRLDDGTYEVEIGIFRIYHIHPCPGKLIDNRIEFSSEQIEGEILNGTITIDEQGRAIVTFLSEYWKEIDNVNTYVYYKTSDKPYYKGQEYPYRN